MKKTKVVKNKIKVRENPNGVSLWVNGRWIVDASCWNEELRLSIDTLRLKGIGKLKWQNHKVFKFNPDKYEQQSKP